MLVLTNCQSFPLLKKLLRMSLGNTNGSSVDIYDALPFPIISDNVVLKLSVLN
jgi:hypothetical protein